MKNLQPNTFFLLKNYKYRSLWVKEKFVWHALVKLKSYLHKQTLGKIEVDIPPSAYLENIELISIGKGSTIEPGAYIKGPCIIGKNCQIRHGAYIRGFVIIGDRCIIGHSTEVINSILLDRVQAAHFAYIGDSILGNDVNLGAGVKCANLRLDKKEITISVENIKLNTSLLKLGSIIGDNAQIGCNTVTNPATFIGKGTRCYPNLSVGGFIPSGVVVKRSIL